MTTSPQFTLAEIEEVRDALDEIVGDASNPLNIQRALNLLNERLISWREAGGKGTGPGGIHVPEPIAKILDRFPQFASDDYDWGAASVDYMFDEMVEFIAELVAPYVEK